MHHKEAHQPQLWPLKQIFDRLHTAKLNQIKMRDYMDKRVTLPKWVTIPTWGPPFMLTRPKSQEPWNW